MLIPRLQMLNRGYATSMPALTKSRNDICNFDFSRQRSKLIIGEGLEVESNIRINQWSFVPRRQTEKTIESKWELRCMHYDYLFDTQIGAAKISALDMFEYITKYEQISIM